MAYSDKTRGVFAGEIETIKEKGLFKEKRFICSPQGAEIEVEYPEGAPKAKVLNFCANNYLGLSSHPDVVEAAHEGLRERGYGVRDAAILAAKVRLRPILMTAGVLIASMLPLSFHLAPGGEAMVPLARALIGGMLVSTALTLFLVPCVYTLVKRDTQPATI